MKSGVMKSVINVKLSAVKARKAEMKSAKENGNKRENGGNNGMAMAKAGAE
jgi:hypothetical protein